MKAIDNTGNSHRLLINFNPKEYVNHLGGGTRLMYGIDGAERYMLRTLDNVTCATVVYRTPKLIEDCYKTLRSFYPTVKYILIDNSGGDSCTELMRSWLPNDPNLKLIELPENIGHGYGMHRAIEESKTDFLFIFDSDIVFRRGEFLEPMLELMEWDTYGVGWLLDLDMGGRNIPRNFDGEILVYLFDGFWFVNKNRYYKFHKLHKYGLPLFKAMHEIHEQKLDKRILKSFPLKDHYLWHHFGGTRGVFGDVEDIVPGFKGKKGDMGGQLD
jgi:hypothetical protein